MVFLSECSPCILGVETTHMCPSKMFECTIIIFLYVDTCIYIYIFYFKSSCHRLNVPPTLPCAPRTKITKNSFLLTI